MGTQSAAQNVRVVGRYALYGAIAAGGMATVHLGRLLGPVGFSRTVAIKRLHAQFASDPEFVSMFLDEARLAARIRHPNVVPTLDVVATGGELFLVMEYVPGESVARLSRALRERKTAIPLRILSAIMAGMLHGLHAAHEAKDERGLPLGIVHRDMSPQNVLVGTDGVPRVLDFGVAKASGRVQTTREGQIKGKLSYMPPEQLRGANVTRQTDIYAAGVMLWELMTGQRLFSGDNEGVIVAKVLEGRVEPPSKVLLRTLSKTKTLTDGHIQSLEMLDETVLKALAMEPEKRYATAREMALEIERKAPPATGSEVADWVELVARDVLSSRAAMVAEIESSATMNAAEGQSHVQSVLSAKSTLQPGQLGVPSSLPPSMPAHAAPPGSHPPHASHPAHGSHPAHASNPSRSSLPPSHAVTAPSMPPDFGNANQTLLIPSGPPVSRSSMPIPFEGPPFTQPSSISVATGTHGAAEADNHGRRTVVAAVIGVLVGAMLLTLVFVYRYAQQRPTAAASAPESAAEPATAGGAGGAGGAGAAAVTLDASMPVATGVAAAPGVTGAVPGTPAATATTTTPAATPAPPEAATAAPTPTPAPTASGKKKPAGGGGGGTSKPAAEPKPPAEDCSTPYWWDAAGVKRYKPQCLTK